MRVLCSVLFAVEKHIEGAARFRKVVTKKEGRREGRKGGRGKKESRLLIMQSYNSLICLKGRHIFMKFETLIFNELLFCYKNKNMVI